MESFFDSFLTKLFAPLSVVGIHKCSRCTIKARLAQCKLALTLPVWFLVKFKRITWEVDAHPEREAFTLIVPQE